MKKVTYHSYQPSLLVNKIKQIKFEKPVYVHHALKLSNNIIYNCMEQNKSLTDYIDLPSLYLKELITEKYGKVIGPLIDEGILEPYVWSYKYQGETVEVKYKMSKAQCKRYRLNPTFTQTNNWIIAPFKTQVDIKDLIDPALKEKVIQLVKEFTIDLPGALLFIDKEIESIKKDDFILNESIEEKTFELNHEDKVFYISKEKALELAAQDSKDLIQDGGNFLIENINTYIGIKKERIKFYYTKSINKLHEQIIYAKRNKTNLRLDTNITQIPSGLISYLTYKGEHLINIDLSNSQFSILSYLITHLIYTYKSLSSNNNIVPGGSIYMCVLFSNPLFLSNLRDSEINKEIIKVFTSNNKLSTMCAYFFDDAGNIYPDVDQFMHASQKGLLYENIVRLLNLAKNDSKEEIKKARKLAKTSMFEVSFSSHRSISETKENVKKAYPSVFNFISAFKKEFGDNQFSILLQIIESTIFIDAIYPKLLQENIMSISKHDSFLVPQSKLEQSKWIIERELESIRLKGRLGIEDTVRHSQETAKNEKAWNPTAPKFAITKKAFFVFAMAA